LFYDNSAEQINIDLDAPKGTSLKAMAEITGEAENLISNTIPAKLLVSSMVIIGEHSRRRGPSATERYENWATITITLIPKSEREPTARNIIKDLRKVINIKNLPSFTKVKMSEEVMGPSEGKAFNMKIKGDDEEMIDSISKKIETFLATIPGVKDIGTDQIEGKEELVLKFNYERLAELNLTVQDVANTVRTAYDGTIATSIQTTNEKLDFRVKVDDVFQKDEKFLLRLLVLNQRGRLIRLRDVATIQHYSGKANIGHYDGDRAITVTANVDDEVITSIQVTRAVMQEFQDVSTRFPGVYLEVGGEAQEAAMSIDDLTLAFIMATILIYFVLILLFKSLSQPFIILVTIPFGVSGALLAFAAHGIPLTFMGIIGIIGLSGVVVNDSIVMTDFINKAFSKSSSGDKKQRISTITTGAAKRLRPVILTTITTVAGVLPTVYGIGGSSQIIVPVVMAMAYGLLFATLLTLLFTPSLYMVNTDIMRLFTRIFRKKENTK
jgi:multidrug efflux pump subunit AcrB